MPHVPHDMSVRDRVPTRTALRTAVRDFRSVSLHPVLDCPDINRFVKTTIADGQILQWDATNSARGEFVNVNPASVSVITSPLVNEIFLSNTGADTGNDGKSSSQPFLTFQRGIYTLGRSDAYDQITVYVNGDVNYNPSENYTEYGGVDRLREGSFGGNLSRGVIIRGLKTGEAAVPLNTASAPRNVTSQLLPSVTVTDLAPGQVTKTAGLTINNLDGAEICSGYTIGSNIPASEFPFFRDNTGNYFPIAWDANLRQDGGAAHNRFFIASHDGVLPNIAQDLNPYEFAGKVIVNNGTVVTNPSFSMGGNIQFVEVHFELEDGVKTPYHVNGEFVILFSKFSKTAGALGSTLELASYGSAGDHTSTLQITTGAPKEGGKVIQIKKSIFENLTIKFDTVTEIEDCVFNNCIIQNPQNVVMSGCILYNSKGVVLGAKNDTHSFKSSIKLRNSGVIYGTDAAADHASHFTLNDDSFLELESVLILPGNDFGGGGSLVAQEKPMCISKENSGVNVNNIKIALTGTNQTADASLFYTIGGVLNINQLDSSAASTSTLPLLLCDATTVELSSFAATTVNTNSLIHATTCDIRFHDFLVVGGLYTVSGGGAVFQFEACNISIDGKFEYTMNSGVTSTLSIFDLRNSRLVNYPDAAASGADGGRFNIQNDETQHSIRAWGSNVSINLGDDILGNPQKDLHGGIDLTNSTLLLKQNVLQTTPGPYKLIYHGTGGKSCLDIKDSKLTIENIDIDGPTNNPTVLNAVDNSVVLIKTSTIQVNGNTSASSINVDHSVLTMVDCDITVAGAGSASSVRIQNSSTFNYRRSDATSCTLTGASDANLALSIENNSNAVLEEVIVTCENPNAIEVDVNSSLIYIGEKSSLPSDTDTLCKAGTATTSSHAVIRAINNSNLYLEALKLESGGGNSAGVTIFKCSKGVFKNLIEAGGTLSNNSGVICIRNSEFHADTTLTSNYTTGFFLGSKSISWSNLQSNGGVAPWGVVSGSNGLWDPTQSGSPEDLFSTANWNAYQSCKATMS